MESYSFNPFYPEHVQEPCVFIPKSWLLFDQDYWPTTSTVNGVKHKVKYTYKIHYMEVDRLIKLNELGELAEELIDQNKIIIANPHKGFEALVWKKAICGKLAVHWYFADLTPEQIKRRI